MLFIICFVIGYMEQSFASSITFYGNTSNSYVHYPIFKSSDTGQIIFEFRTMNPYGLLLYADNSETRISAGSNGNYIKVRLEKGALAVIMQVSEGGRGTYNTKGRHETFGHGLNDNKQHYVEITRNGKDTSIKVDGETKELGFPTGILELHSSIFMGGPPVVKDYMKYRNIEFWNEERFIGCISNVRFTDKFNAYTEKSKKPIVEHKVTPGCQDRCQAEQTLKCENRGRCLNMYTKTGCDCRGTGFTGKTCTEVSQSLEFFGSQYAVWEPSQHIKSFTTEILVRFKSMQASGILVYVAGKEIDEYMLLELHQRSFIFKSKQRGMEESVTRIQEPSVNETMWRFVRVIQKGTKTTVSLIDRITEYDNSVNKIVSKPIQSPFEIKKVYFGGVNVHKVKVKPKSKSMFTGCLQDVVVNNVDLIDLALKKDAQMRLNSRLGIGCSLKLEQRNREQILEITKKEEKHSTDESDSQIQIWIIVGACFGALIPFVIISLAVRYILRKRAEKHRQYRDHYLRQTGMRIEVEDLLPTEQKCIREEIAKRKLQTFSPLRKQFYVSPSDAGSIPRSRQEPIYQSHEVFTHAHPCIGQNYAMPVQMQQQRHQNVMCQQTCHSSPSSSHYALSRKCSHASSIRYQTPNVKTADSIKSFSSQQS